jgi:hypothetical protein
MTAAGPDVVELVRVFTPLGLALHDLVSDTRVVEGLSVDARPVGGGRVSAAFQTKSGAYAFRGLEGMRAVELPAAGEPGSLPAGRDFDVSVVDLRGRFVPMVLRVPVPTDGLVTQTVLELMGGVPTASVTPDELPLYLFSSPSRALPTHLAVVRAQLADDASGAPASFARLEVVVDPDGPGRRRYSGVSDETGAVVVPFAYPRFGAVPGGMASVPAAGTRGEPTTERTWPLRVLVHYDPDVLVHPPGLPAPVLHSVLAQRQGQVRATAGGPAGASLEATLQYSAELVLRTTGDRESRLLVGAAAP